MSVFTEYSHGQFNWVDLNSHDMAAASEFYSALFDWSCATQDTQGGPPYGIFNLGEHQIAGIGEMDEEMKSSGMPPMWNSYINVDGIESVVEQVGQLGGNVIVPVMQVMDAGKLAFIQEPSGGICALWEKGNHIGATLCNDTGAFCWNELATREIDKAKTFFQDLLGWTYDKNEQSPAEYYIIKNGDRMNGGIMAMDESWGEIPSHWTVYFSVADVNASTEKLKALGGKVMHGPFETEVGPISVCSDPQGAMFNLIQMSDEPE